MTTQNTSSHKALPRSTRPGLLLLAAAFLVLIALLLGFGLRPVEAQLPAPLPGVELEPDREGSGLPGQLVVYTHTLTNTDPYWEDSFVIVATSSRGWNVQVEPSLISNVLPGQKITIFVSITVPVDAPAGMVDVTGVTARSMADPSIVDVVIDRTEALLAIVPATGCTLYSYVPSVLWGSVGVYGQPFISALGSTLAYWSTAETLGNRDGNIEVFLSAADQSQFLQISHSTGSILGGFNLEPTVSADGNHVAFFSDRDLVGKNSDANLEIFVFDRTATVTLTQVTDTRAGVNVSPSLDGSGHRVAFASDREFDWPNSFDNQEIVLYDLDTRRFTPVTRTDKGYNDQPAVSGDGRYIAFVSTASDLGTNSDGSQEVFVYDTQTQDPPDQVTDSRRTSCVSDQPVISGDGRYVAYASNCDPLGFNRDGSYEIFLYDTGTNTRRQVTEAQDRDSDQPAIGQGGLLLAFVSDANLTGENPEHLSTIYLYDIANGSHLQLVRTTTGAAAHPSLVAGEANIAFDYNRRVYRIKCEPSKLELTKLASKSVVIAGENLEYTLTVFNPGPLAASGLKLIDTLPAGVSYISDDASCVHSGGTVTCELGLLSNGQSRTVVITARVEPSTRGTIVNEATASAALAEPDTDTVATTVEAQISLDLTKTGSPDPTVVAGEKLTYTLTVYNGGPSQATGVVLTDTLPAHTTLQLPLPTGCSRSGDIVTCNLNSINPTRSKTRTLIVTVDYDYRGTLTNKAGVTATEISHSIPKDLDTDVIGEADLDLTKSDLPDPVTAGEWLTYTLSVVNHGPSDARNVTLTDTLPSEVISSTVVTSTAPASLTCDPVTVGGQLICDLGTMDPVDSAEITLTVQVESGARLSMTNQASVGHDETDPDAGNSTDIEETTIEARVDLSVTKTASTPVFAGGQVTYTLTVSNAVPSMVKSLTLTDTLPPSTTVAYATPGYGTTDGAVIWTLVDLWPRTATSVTLVLDVDQQAEGTLTNRADVLPIEPDTDGANNWHTVTSPVAQQADLAVYKTAEPARVAAGTVVTFTLTYTNAGPSVARDVVLIDTLPPGLTFGGLVTPASGLSGPTTDTPPDLVWTADVVPAQTPSGVFVDTIVFTATVGASAPDGPLSNLVTINSTTYDPGPGQNSYAATITVTTVADLSIVKWHEPEPSEVGAVLTYTLVYTNAGPSYARNVTITDVLPSDVTFGGIVYQPPGLSGPSTAALSILTWTTPTLPFGPGDNVHTGTLAFTVTVNTVVSAPLSNTVEISSTTQDDDPTNNHYEEAATIKADLAITKISIPKNGAVPGKDTLTYVITVTNPSACTVVGATVYDALPATYEVNKGIADVTWDCTGPTGSGCTPPAYGDVILNDTVTVAVGGTVVYTATGKLDQDPPEYTLLNTATVTVPVWISDTKPGDNTAFDTHVLAPESDLEVSKTVDNPQPATDDRIQYTLVVTNYGASKAHDVTLIDKLPVGVKFYDSSNPRDYDEDSGLWTIGNMNSGASRTLTLTADVTETVVGTPIINVARDLTSTKPIDQNLTNNRATATITVTAYANLAITKTVTGPDGVPGQSTTARPGDPITYTLEFENKGPNTATGVVITDFVPAGLMNRQVFSSGVTITDISAGTDYVWQVADLALKDSGTITITGVLIDSLPQGSFINTAVISGTVLDGDSSNNDSTASVTVIHQANLAITKTVTGLDGVPRESTTARPGEPITYTLAFNNGGPQPATGVVITDIVPVSVTVQSIDSNVSIVEIGAGTDYVWQVADLANGASGTITITGVLNDALPEGTFRNAASISSTVEDNDLSDNEDWADVTVIRRADLVITKLVIGVDGSPAFSVIAEPGEPITYTIGFTNYGPQPATGVVITDWVPVSVTVHSVVSSGVVITDITVIPASPPYVWQVADLAKDGNGTITITGVLSDVLPQATFRNTATISSAVVDDWPWDNEDWADVTIIHRPHLTITKAVTPTVDAFYLGTVTYTIVLSNSGLLDADAAVLTDTLPGEVTFARWVQYQPPADVNGDVIYWNGTVTASQTITFGFVVTHTGAYGDVVTNTVEYSHATSSGAAEAVFTVQPFAVSIAGPSTGVTNTSYTFTATVVPAAIFPLTYTWQATDFVTPIPQVRSALTDTIAYTWPIQGTKSITVEVTNLSGTVRTTHPIVIGP